MAGEIIVPAASAFGRLINSAGKHAPIILTCVAGVSAISATVSAVKATPKATILLQQKKEEIAKEEGVKPEEIDLSLQEIIQTTWKLYVPAAAFTTVSLGCMFGAAHINNQRQLGWAALYSATKKASDAYERQVIEHVGAKENEEIHRKVVQQELKDNPVSRADVIATGKGPYLCYDTLSGRYFMSDIETIRRVVNDMNQMMIGQMYISLNEFYQELGLLPVDLGYDNGWNVDELIDVQFSTMMADDGRPCLVLQYLTQPRYSYNK